MRDTGENLAGKRIAAVDFGEKRTGLAVCDELHISCNPRGVFDTGNENFFGNLQKALADERAAAVVVGYPYTRDGSKLAIHEKIDNFIRELVTITGLAVYKYDESGSSAMASQMMLSAGVKKKKRSARGAKDPVAASIILRNFLDEIDN